MSFGEMENGEITPALVRLIEGYYSLNNREQYHFDNKLRENSDTVSIFQSERDVLLEGIRVGREKPPFVEPIYIFDDGNGGYSIITIYKALGYSQKPKRNMTFEL